jgi:ring-1,2-phenylacetyl-CoA epoxidase subunit PaaA
MVAAGPRQKREVQAAVDRWWPRTLAMFGPPDDQSSHGATLMRWGLKLAGNEALRQSWLTKFVPQIVAMGLEVPDDALALDEESGRWSYTAPDWAEFRSLLRGGSPMGTEIQSQLKKARWVNRWLSAAPAVVAA